MPRRSDVFVVGSSSTADGYGWRFWAIIISLSVTSLLSALDVSVIATALPTIVKDLGSSYAFIWISNAYFVTMTAFQPLYGQTANIFGRRVLTLLAVFLFAAGSAVSGSAPSIGALIAGRAIQGAGGGGINIMIEIIVADLVPLRERPKFISIIFTAYTVAIALGPVIGGLLAERVSWRWVFYLNLPISGVSLVLLFFVLHVRYIKDTTLRSLKRVDFGGNVLLIASVVSILLALTWGGVIYSWGSWHTIVPLILGFLGLAGFLFLQSTAFVPEPTMPLKIFSNRTSLGGFGLTFIHSMLIYWLSYFLPLYFQSALEASPITSGVNLLPSVTISLPFAILAGICISKFGHYRIWHFLGVSTLAISFGLCSLLNENTTTAYWAGIQAVGAIGAGILTTTTLPAIQAPLDEKDQAVSTATWGFVRSFGGVWGVAIPTAVFNSKVNELAPRVGNETVREMLINGKAYGLASTGYIASLRSDPPLQIAVKHVYVSALRVCWQVGIGFALIGFLIACIIKEIPLRTDLETEFGLDVQPQPTTENAETKANDNTERDTQYQHQKG
ncbi:putative multidrug resistance protein fnx1 [Hypoxylon argillaceum]|nr:putative multidrug resistance protein fnx1 [Hypoxylon argillaceum]